MKGTAEGRRPLTHALVVLAVACGALATLSAPPARAEVRLSNYVELPTWYYGAIRANRMVVLPSEETVLIAGGVDSPVVRYDVASHEVTPIPGTDSVETLNLDKDGVHVTGAIPTTHEVVRIDTSTDEVSTWDVGEEGPYDAIRQDGRFIVSTDVLASLDPATGTLTPIESDGSPISDPGRLFGLGADDILVTRTYPERLVLDGNTATVAAVSSERVHYPLMTVLSDDRTELVLAHPRKVLDVATLESVDAPEPVSGYGNALQLTPDYMLADDGSSGLLIRRDPEAATPPVAIRPPEDAGTGPLAAHLFDDGRLLWVGYGLDDSTRLYWLDTDLRTAPDLRIRSSWAQTGVDEPFPVSGHLLGEGIEAGSVVELSVAETGETLGSATTAADGTWSTDVALSSPGDYHVLASYEGSETPVEDTRRITVLSHHYVLTMEAPRYSTEDPAQATGQLTLNGRPAPGETLEVQACGHDKDCSYLSGAQSRPTTDAEGNWSAPVSWGANENVNYRAVFKPAGEGNTAYSPQVTIGFIPFAVESHGSWRTDVSPSQQYSGISVDFSVTLSDDDGGLAGQTVEIFDSLDGGSPVSLGTTVLSFGGNGTLTAPVYGVGDHDFSAHVPATDHTLETTVPVGPTMTIDARPTWVRVDEMSASVGVPVDVTGEFIGRDGPVELAVTTPDGTSSVDTTTGGEFSHEVAFADRGTFPVTVSYAGDDEYAAASTTIQVRVVRRSADLAVVWPQPRFWETTDVVGTVGDAETGGTVVLRVNGTEVDRQEVEGGTFSLSWLNLDVEPSLTVAYQGDDRTESGSATSTLTAIPHEALPVTARARRPDSRRGKFALYRRSRSPSFIGSIQVDAPGLPECVDWRLQRRTARGWVRAGTYSCIGLETNRSSYFLYTPKTRPPAGQRLRVRMFNPGPPEKYKPSLTGWVYFGFK